MATAKKLPSGSWRCRVFSHYEYVKQSDGTIKKKSIYESFTSQDPSSRGKKEAERMAAEFAYKKERMERTDYTLKEAMNDYIESKKNVLSTTTIRGYHSLIRNAYTELEGKRTKRITRQDVQSWVNRYSVDHSPKSVCNAHGFLTAVLNVYEPDLRLNTKLPEKCPSKLYTPSDDDVKKLLEYIKGTELEKAVLLAAFGTLRRGEICALTNEDIHGDSIIINKSMVRADGGKFIIKTPKTVSSNRVVEYPHFVIEKFKGVEGRLVNIHPEDISKNFGKVLQEAGLPPFRFHDLRHYSASIMHAIGIPDQYIMARGGWKTDTVLKSVYRNVIDDEQKKFTDKINSHFDTICHDI